MHGDVGAIASKLKGNRAAEAGGGSCNEGFQAVEIAWLSRRHHPLLFADFSLRDGVERFLRDSARFVVIASRVFAGHQIGVVEKERRTP
jgi:hypothetical protein